jgi:hypothetical protein
MSCHKVKTYLLQGKKYPINVRINIQKDMTCHQLLHVQSERYFQSDRRLPGGRALKRVFSEGSNKRHFFGNVSVLEIFAVLTE